MKRDAVLAAARFDTKLRTYLFLNVLLILVSSVIGIVLVPLAIPIALWWSRRYFESISCTLTPRSLVVRKGTIFREEKTIPLDKITDLTLRHGPVLRALGICTLRIETAGQAKQPGSADANLTGIVDAIAFRDRVLEQRDRITDHAPALSAGSGAAAGEQADDVLAQIRDTLLRIEERLGSGVGAD